ncbi:hypothetical protein BC938DRAFT_481409 [Jimgerdemannia flammicorona]|uniref:SH3 domain-containing protein n=1 Tax=Jimgerdemannia flammicorona TaxID=994334 RepID=A0A433QGW7_9FUNG|nr:hypothetical protein BC938DRAFT_481409 [Jimgerdemannia flammicorona]
MMICFLPNVAEPPLSIIMLKAKAIFDCTADDDAELTFVEGDIIIDVVQSAEEGWYDGRLERTNKRGLFPHNYVKIFEDTSKPTPPPRPAQTSKPSDAIPAPTTIRPSTSSTSSSSQWSTISASVPKDETTPFAKPKTWAGFGDNFDSDQPVKSSATKDIQDAFGAARPGKLPTAALATFTAAQNHSSSPTPALLTRLKPETKPKSATATTAVAAKQGSADDDAEVDMPFMSVKAMRASLEGAGNKPLTRSATGKSVLDEDEPPVLLRPSSIKQQQQQQATKKDIPVLPAPKPLVVKKSQPEPTPVVAEDDPEPQTLRPSTIRRQQLLGGKNDGSTSTTPMPTAIAPKPRLPDRPSGTPPLQPKPDGQRTRLVSQSQTDAPVGGAVLPPLLPRKPGLSATVAEKEPPLLPRRPAAGQNGAGVGGEEAGDGGEPPKLPMRPKLGVRGDSTLWMGSLLLGLPLLWRYIPVRPCTFITHPPHITTDRTSVLLRHARRLQLHLLRAGPQATGPSSAATAEGQLGRGDGGAAASAAEA